MCESLVNGAYQGLLPEAGCWESARENSYSSSDISNNEREAFKLIVQTRTHTEALSEMDYCERLTCASRLNDLYRTSV